MKIYRLNATLWFFLLCIALTSGCAKTETAAAEVQERQPKPVISAEDESEAVTEAESELESEPETDEYAFVYNGIDIHMGGEAEPVTDALGEPLGYFEAPSCAFNGLDKIYYYSGIEIYTYPMDDVDYISSIIFSDDSVSTLKGIRLGMDLNKVIESYGDDYDQELEKYTYTLGESLISFLIEGDQVASITYSYANE